MTSIRPRAILITIIILLISFGCHEFNNPVDPYYGLVAYYPFDGDAKNSTDIFGSGTLSGGVVPAEDRNGKASGALKFDGEDDYIKVNDSETLRIQEELTLSAWVKLDEISWDYARIVVKEFGDGIPYVSYGLMADHNASRRFGFHLSDEYDVITYIQADDTHSAGVWYHVAGVWNGSTMFLYVNGQQQQETASFTGEIAYPDFIGSSGAALNMGGDTARNIEYLNGSIDDVRVYSRALSATEIAAIHSGADPITAPGAGSSTSLGLPYRLSGSGNDIIYAAALTSDGGSVMAGSTDSFGAGSADAWVLKFDSAGEPEWQKSFGGTLTDIFWSAVKSLDGGIFLGGYTSSFGAGNYDCWLVKIDSAGDVLWEKTFGTAASSEKIYSVAATSDGGCILTGEQLWVIKLDSSGNLEWHKSYLTTATGTHTGYEIRQLTDGSYIVGGYVPTASSGVQAVLIKLTSSGIVEWAKTFGGTDNEYLSCLEILSDGGIITGANSTSYGAGESDMWFTKFSSSGVIEWQKSFGTASNEFLREVSITSDGDFLFSGCSTGLDSYRSPWAIKTDSSGSILWQKSYDNEYYSTARANCEITAGRYLLGSFAMKETGGNYDAVRLELNSDGECGTLLTSTSVSATDTASAVVDANLTVTNESETITNSSATVTVSTAAVTEITE